MLLKNIIRWSALLSVLFTLLFMISSCDSDDETNSQIVLESFGPTGVEHGDKIVFIGRNLDQVTAIELVGSTVEQSEFTQQNAELIELIVPQEAGAGKVILKTPQGDIESKTVLSFLVPVVIDFESLPTEVKPGSTLTIKGEFVNWITEVWFQKDVLATEFISKSVNEIVVKVPLTAQSGIITFITGGTEPLKIQTEQEITVTLPHIITLSPNPVERESNLTITGSDLDLVMGVLFKGLTEPITEFVSQSQTEIVVTVPGEANKGDVALVAISGIETLSPEPLGIVGDLPPLTALNYAFYIDAIENGWANWGWGGAVDFDNADNVRDGEKAIKKTYDGTWDALRLHGGPVTTSGYTEVTFSIYGETGTNGLKLNVIANEQWGAPYVITVVEGEWTEYKLTFADFGSPASISDFLFQAQGWSGTLYVDHVGLR